MPDSRFGISTHLFGEVALGREHLERIAAHGFECIELVASRSHFDYHSDQAVTQLVEWLAETGLRLCSVHAPVMQMTQGREATGWLSNAAADDTRRQAAIEETRAVLSLADRLRFDQLVVHLGVPSSSPTAATDNHRSAARRSAETIAELSHAAGVRVAFEIHDNALSRADTLVRMLEDDLEGTNASLCLDYGHGHLAGDLAEAIETVAGHLTVAHLHDNNGRYDAHLVPYSGTIDWESAMTETQKVGYDGVLVFEVASQGDPQAQLARAVKARERLARALITF